MKRTSFGCLLLMMIVIGINVLVDAQRTNQTPTYLVDLLTHSPDQLMDQSVPESDRLRLPFGRGGRPTDEPPQDQPLSLTVLAMDRTVYQVGESFVYELLVSNAGRTAIAFPTSTQLGHFRRNTPRAVGAFVNLMVDDSSLGQQVLGVQELYGAPSVPGSLVMLSPGETLEIRATGVWHLQSAYRQQLPSKWSRTLGVRGVVHLFTKEDPPPAVTSGNVWSVTLSR